MKKQGNGFIDVINADTKLLGLMEGTQAFNERKVLIVPSGAEVCNRQLGMMVRSNGDYSKHGSLLGQEYDGIQEINLSSWGRLCAVPD